MLGDRWSLLIIRDMMLRGSRTYKEFLESYEKIATNILADRLRKLIAYGIITAGPDPSDGRKRIYLLTAKGIDLAPVMTEMVLGERLEQHLVAGPARRIAGAALLVAEHREVDLGVEVARTGNQPLVRLMREDKEKFLAGVRQGWANRV